jgi:hypothetical protein
MVARPRLPDSSRPRSEDGFERWLSCALLLHLGALAVIAASNGPSASRSNLVAVIVGAEASASFELIDEEPRASAPSVVPETAAATTVRERSKTRAGFAAERPVAMDAPMNGERAAALSEGEAQPAPQQLPRHLSLGELGVGVDGSGAILVPSLEPAKMASAESRLQDSMLSGLALADRAKGLGIEEPAVRAVTELVLASDLPLATRATLLFVTDSAGSTRTVSVLESGADSREWQRIAARLKQVLVARKLRLPARSEGASFQLVITSRERLASGAVPKLETEVFGSARQGPGPAAAARISLLPRKPATARAQFPLLEGSHPQPWAGFTTNIGYASADLSDLNPRSQRSVTAEIAQLDLGVPLAAYAR